MKNPFCTEAPDIRAVRTHHTGMQQIEMCGFESWSLYFIFGAWVKVGTAPGLKPYKTVLILLLHLGAKKKNNLTCFGFLYLPHGSGRSHLLMLPTWNLRLCMYKNPLLRAHISCSVGSVNHEHLHSATLPEKHPWERIFPALYKQCQGDPCTFWMLSKPGRRAVTTPQGPSDDVLWLQTRLAEPELTLRDNPSKKTSLETQHRQPTPSAPRGAASSEQIKELGAAVGWQELLSHRNYASQASHWWSLCKSPSIYKLSPLKHISHRQVCVPSMRKSCGNFMLVIILNPSTST